MLIHTIGTRNKTWPTENFINKYIFPGGELPHLSHMVWEDKWTMEHFENFGHSYTKTCRAWYNNVSRDNWGGLPSKKYDDRFKRIWTFYLLSCAALFRSTTTLCGKSYTVKGPRLKIMSTNVFTNIVKKIFFFFLLSNIGVFFSLDLTKYGSRAFQSH